MRNGASAVIAAVALGDRLATVLAVAGLMAVITSTRRGAVIATTRRRAALAIIARWTSRVNAELVATELDAFDLVEGTLVVVTVVVLNDALFGTGSVDVGERDGTVLTADVLEILPARVGRQVGNDATELAAADPRLTSRRRRSAVAGGGSVPTVAATTAGSTIVGVGGIASRLTTTLCALCLLNYDSLAHKVFAIKVLDGIFSVTGVLELDKAKRAHDANIVEAAIVAEEVFDVSTTDIGGKFAYVDSSGHDVLLLVGRCGIGISRQTRSG